MTVASLWAFVREQGVELGEVIFAVVGALLIIGGVLIIRDKLRYLVKKDVRRPRVVWDHKTLGFLLQSFGIGTLILCVSWSSIHKRYLVRPGAGRFTVGTVVQHTVNKGHYHFVCAYHVQGQLYQITERCDRYRGRGSIDRWLKLLCPSRGTRHYVYFSPLDPSVSQMSNVPVPDTLRSIPPLGWARLP